MITVNDVRRSLINVLGAEYPESEIYGEEIKQGFTEPCFFVKLFPVSQDKELGNRYKRYHAFDIHYFPATAFSNDECHEIAEQLYEKIEYLAVNNRLIRGEKMNHQVEDNVLHFFVDYDFHILKDNPAGPQKKMLKGGVTTWLKS